MVKKTKKGKKGKNEIKGPEPVTTLNILQDRTKMLCPRMGDVYSKNNNVEDILQDVAESYLHKVIDNQSNSINLGGLKLTKFPTLINVGTELDCLIDINLSKNNLFNGDEVFEALSHLPFVTKLNLSENFLNGTLSRFAGLMEMLEVLNLDVNNLTALCPAVQNWTNLRIFTISDNSLIDLPIEASSWNRLTVLNMKNNKVMDIGSLPQYWPLLERLYLGSNLVNSVPYEIGKCKNLSVLDFSCNSIQTLPLSLGQCHALKALYLGSNKIEHLPPEIFACLTNLRELHLYKNKITSIPPEIGNLQGISSLLMLFAI
mmetsp:Transcript_10784/g.16241  ORF Transcript_10784/g.16241 Transcript_10784/m.16241 type:complete len:316 (+) Transcript_10784:53-1000(+)